MLLLPAALAPAGEVGLAGGRAGGPSIRSSTSEANGSEPSMPVKRRKSISSRV